MKIALISPPWVPTPPPGWGGIEFSVAQLAKGLVAKGHDVTLFCRPGEPIPGVKMIEPICTPHDGYRKFKYEQSWLTRALQIVSGSQPVFDVIDDHTSMGQTFFRTEIPVVTTEHMNINEVTAPALVVAGNTSALIAISHAQRRQGERFGIQFADTIHHGLPMSEFAVGSGAGDVTGTYHLFVGRITPDKGVHIAAKAFREKGVRLLLAGPVLAEDMDYFECKVKPYCDQQTVVRVGGLNTDSGGKSLPGVERSALKSLMQNARTLVMPIQWDEPFGLVVIEANASGLPVVTADRGAPPELIVNGTTGLVWDGDPSTLVATCLEAAELDRSACRAHAEKHFSIEALADHRLKLYEAVIERGPLMPMPAGQFLY